MSAAAAMAGSPRDRKRQPLRRIAGDTGPSRPREVPAPRDHSHRLATAAYYHHVSMPPHLYSVLREALQLFSNHCYTVLVTNQGEERRGWFVLIYKLPAEPTRLRASVWRKLKAAGAVYLQNGVAALPEDAAGERAMRGAVQEVRDFGGTAHLLRGEALGDEAALVEAFGEARDAEYAEILSKCRDFHAELEKERAAGKFTFAELEENEEDLDKLGPGCARWSSGTVSARHRPRRRGLRSLRAGRIWRRSPPRCMRPRTTARRAPHRPARERGLLARPLRCRRGAGYLGDGAPPGGVGRARVAAQDLGLRRRGNPLWLRGRERGCGPRGSPPRRRGGSFGDGLWRGHLPGVRRPRSRGGALPATGEAAPRLSRANRGLRPGRRLPCRCLPTPPLPGVRRGAGGRGEALLLPEGRRPECHRPRRDRGGRRAGHCGR